MRYAAIGMPELQLEGLPSPTFCHGGLSHGNLASQQHAGAVSHPRAAARQCLAKMRLVQSLGLPIALLPPLARPDASFLRHCGFTGTDHDVVAAAMRQAPALMPLALSSASVWAANCATVIPSWDSGDGRVHFVPANLVAMPHRTIEAEPRAAMLRRLFADPIFAVHDPLPSLSTLGDEGAANHHRASMGGRACHVFVYGRAHDTLPEQLPQRFPTRQTELAGESIARLGGIAHPLHVRQHPAAIDAGAFHNDVVMVGDRTRVLIHAQAWVDQASVLAELVHRVPGLRVREVTPFELDLSAAVRSYLFNGQLLKTGEGGVLLVPTQCVDTAPRRVLDRLVDEGFLTSYRIIDVAQSMMGGGGPACLRLRVPLTPDQLARVHRGIMLTPERIAALESWVDATYRESLHPDDLRDPRLTDECEHALELLTRLLGTGPLYAFQR